MIGWFNKQPNEIKWKGKSVIAIYMANKEVWTSFLSCFGKGYWIDQLTWSDDDVWVD